MKKTLISTALVFGSLFVLIALLAGCEPPASEMVTATEAGKMANSMLLSHGEDEKPCDSRMEEIEAMDPELAEMAKDLMEPVMTETFVTHEQFNEANGEIHAQIDMVQRAVDEQSAILEAYASRKNNLKGLPDGYETDGCENN